MPVLVDLVFAIYAGVRVLDSHRVTPPFIIFSLNTEINDLRKIICLRKSEIFVKRIAVYNDIKQLVEHGGMLLHQCVIELLP